MENRVRRSVHVIAVSAVIALVAVVASALPPPAPPPSPEDLARAEALFQLGKKLLDEGKAAEACPKLEESLHLDPGGGTQIALALCHLAEGKTASAWAELEDARAMAQRDGRRDREDYVKARLAELKPKLSFLTLDVGRGGGDLSGVELKRDGAPIARPEWGVAVPLDPGVHVVTLSAPGHPTVTRSVVIGKEGDRQRLTISFGDEAPAPAPAPVPTTVPTTERSATPPPSTADARRTAAYVAGGAGALGLVVATVFGVRAIGAWNDAKRACPARDCTDPQGVARHDDASTAATIADVGLGVAIAGLGVATYLFLDGGPPSQAKSLRIGPVVSAGRGGFLAEGRW